MATAILKVKAAMATHMRPLPTKFPSEGRGNSQDFSREVVCVVPSCQGIQLLGDRVIAVNIPVNHQTITYTPGSNSSQTNWLTKRDLVK